MSVESVVLLIIGSTSASLAFPLMTFPMAFPNAPPQFFFFPPIPDLSIETFPMAFPNAPPQKKLFPIRDLLLVGLSHLDVQNRTFWHLHFLPPFVSSQRGKRFGVFVSVLWNDNRGGRSVAIPIFNSCHFFAHCCGKTQSDFLLISAAVCKCQKMAKNGFVSEKTHEGH